MAQKQLGTDPAASTDAATKSYVDTGLGTKEATITAGTTGQYWRGDKSWQTLDKSAVGLGNVDNTSDSTKNGASATLTNKTVDLASNTVTGTTAQFNTALSDADFATQAGSETLTNKSISGSSNTLTNIAQSSVTNLTTDLSAKQATSEKGAANGYASLDSGGKVPVAQLPNSIMEYQGTWNPSTNSPTLADGTGSAGDVYRVSASASRDLGSGSIAFTVGDYAIYNGSTWEKADTTDAVATVNGYTGNVSLTTSDIGEGTNLYYTNTRADGRITNAVGSTVQAYSANLTGFAAKTAPTGSVVGTSDSQALTNKDLSGAGNTFPTLNQNTTGSAATLTTGRTVQTNLASTSSATFDGSANITPGVTGTLPVTSGGTGVTTITGLVKGGGTAAFSAATAGTDYVAPGGALGTPSSGTLTNCTIPLTGVVSSYTSPLGVGRIELGDTSDTTLTRSAAGKLAVEGVDVLLNGGSLGTPSSGTLTNCGSLPVSGITSSTTTALGLGSVELGHVSDTTLSRSAAGVLAVEGVVVPTVSSTSTLTNKWVQPRIGTTTSSATPSIDITLYDQYNITALAAAITSVTVTGSPVDGQKLIIRIKDNGTLRAITWGSSFQSSGTATLITTTVASKTHLSAFIYDSVATKWVCVAADGYGY